MKFADVIGEQPGVHQHQGVEALHPLKRAAHALRTAPILADHHEAAKPQLIDQRYEVGNVVGERESRVDARVVGVAGTNAVRNDYPITGAYQRSDEVTIKEA